MVSNSPVYTGALTMNLWYQKWWEQTWKIPYFPSPAFCLGDGSRLGHWFWNFLSMGRKELFWDTMSLVAAGKPGIEFRKTRAYTADTCRHIWHACPTCDAKLICLTFLYRKAWCCWAAGLFLLGCSMDVCVGDSGTWRLIGENKVLKMPIFWGTEVFSKWCISILAT